MEPLYERVLDDMPSRVIFGPAGCGKSKHALELAHYFHLSVVVDDWVPGKGGVLVFDRKRCVHRFEFRLRGIWPKRVLYLTETRPKGIPPELGIEVMRFSEAMKRANL